MKIASGLGGRSCMIMFDLLPSALMAGVPQPSFGLAVVWTRGGRPLPRGRHCTGRAQRRRCLPSWPAHQRTTLRWSGDDVGRATAVEAARRDLCQGRRWDILAKVLELSEETYHQLADLAERQRRPVEDMLRLCLETCRHHRL